MKRAMGVVAGVLCFAGDFGRVTEQTSGGGGGTHVGGSQRGRDG